MASHKAIDRICALAMAVCLVLTLVLMNAESFGIQAVTRTTGYEDRLFDTTQVHTIDIIIDDWDGFLETAQSEEYSICSVVIDGEAYKNVGIRGKGNTSLSSVSSMDSERYSFKIEFDQYDSTKSYYGLDKLCLNNLIQDNTMMKDYLTYQMMAAFGVDAPLCSFVYITVNGEDWGLYLAVEGIEESFLQRNYGSDYGELYKPDSMSMGGGRGNGRDFNMEDFLNTDSQTPDTDADSSATVQNGITEGFTPGNMPNGGGFSGRMPGDADASGETEETMPADFDPTSQFGGKGGDSGSSKGNMGGGMSSSDVLLQYIDEDPDSYSNIFTSAKTDVTDEDQQRLIDALNTLSNGEDPTQALDVEEVIRYFVVHNYVVNGDSYTGSMIHNYYLYEEDGKLSMIPWDYNLAFGGFQGSNASDAVNDPIDTPLSVGSGSSRPMIDWIFDSEEYTESYHALFAEFLETVDPVQMVREAAALIDAYVQKDPTKFCTYAEFESAVATLEEFCQLRTESVRGQLEGTIASTSDGQRTDSTSLVDASSINISDMGSMGNTMGGGGFSRNDNTEATMPQGGMQMPDSTGETSGGAGQMPSGGMEMPQGGFNGQQSSEDGTIPEGASEDMTVPEGFSGGQMPDGQMPGGMQMPSGSEETGTATEPTGEESQESDGQQSTEKTFGGRNTMDREAFAQSSGGAVGGNQSGLILLAVSLGVLLLGILVAFKFRR